MPKSIKKIIFFLVIPDAKKLSDNSYLLCFNNNIDVEIPDENNNLFLGPHLFYK